MALIRSLFTTVTLLFLLSSCGLFKEEENSSSSQDNIQTKTEYNKNPFSITYDPTLANKTDSNTYSIVLRVQHVRPDDLSVDDLSFQWPSFIEDENHLPYEVQSVNYFEDEYLQESLESHEFVIEMNLSTGEVGQSNYFFIPFIVDPVLFLDGYPFHFDHDETATTTIGDLTLEDVKISGQDVSFDLYDPLDQYDRPMRYQITLVDNEELYPVTTTRTESSNGRSQLLLTFSSESSLPLEFRIRRETVPVPSWQSTFILPIY